MIHLVLFERSERDHVYVAAERIITVSPLADVRGGAIYAVRGSELLVEGAPTLIQVPYKPDEVARMIAEAAARDTVYPTGDPEGGGR